MKNIFFRAFRKVPLNKERLNIGKSQNGDGQLGEDTSVTTDSGKGMHYNKNIHK